MPIQIGINQERKTRIYKDSVSAERDRRISTGGTFAVTGAYIPMLGGPADRENLKALADVAQMRISSGDTTTVTAYRDAHDVVHNLVPGQLIELYSGAVAYVQAVYEASWTLKDGVPVGDVADDVHWPTVPAEPSV